MRFWFETRGTGPLPHPWLLIAVGAVAWPAPGLAQTATAADSGNASTSAAPQPDRWTATLAGGYAARDNGPEGGFAVAALTRQIGSAYLRGGITRYRSTYVQADTALPSTYLVGTLGAGGNWRDWVADIWASDGWQTYGNVESNGMVHPSTGARGSPYYAAGGDFGRIFTLAPRWYATPTLTVNYSYGRLLHPSPDPARDPDFQTSEPAWTGIAALRLDRSLGGERQHLVGLAISYHRTSDGLSVLTPPAGGDPQPGVLRYPDGWAELGGNVSLRLSRHLWLDAGASRSFGARIGDMITAGGGLRFGFR